MKVTKPKLWGHRPIQGSTGSGRLHCFTSGSQFIWLSLEKRWELLRLLPASYFSLKLVFSTPVMRMLI